MPSKPKKSVASGSKRSAPTQKSKGALSVTKKRGNNGNHRPTDYRPEYDEQARKLCLLGATDAEMADFFGVTEQTVNNWKTDFPSFFESLKKGKEYADANVSDRLYQRAMGFEHDSEEIKVVSIGTNSGSEVVRVPVVKVYPPDTLAAIFWLKNRRPKEWRDKQEHEINGGMNIEVTFRDPRSRT